MIRFLEARFARGRADLIESNITPWRRAVVGDLTSAFNFRTPNTDWKVRLPDTDDFKPVDLVRYPDQVPIPPADPRLPGQERGVRPARAVPYTLHADGHASGTPFSIEFRSRGRATGVFQVRSADPAQDPRGYTVEPGRQLTDTWDAASGYDLSVHGPNGFFRRFRGGVGDQPASLDIGTRYGRRLQITLEIENRGAQPVEVTVVDRYSSRSTTLSLKPGDAETKQWSLGRTRGWYDLVVTVDSDPGFENRYAGHAENGKSSISDPGMGGLL